MSIIIYHFSIILVIIYYANSKLLEINLNPKTVTISGLSSGGYMAGQFHLAHSKYIKSVGIFSAGPYYCSRGEVSRALEDCTIKPENLNIDYLIEKAVEFQNLDLIDSLKNIFNQNVFIFSGLLDTRVFPEVSQKLKQFYLLLNANVNYLEIENSEHAFPTDIQGNNPCSYRGSPFINYCNQNGALSCINHLLPNKLNVENSNKTYNEDNLIKIDQSKYFNEEISMNDVAYVYVPDSCKSKVCDLHVAFHGCRQTLQHIEKEYMIKTGYLDIAEKFDLVILFPQAKISEKSPINPLGCWDYWGYNEEEIIVDKLYATKKGKQISAIWRMINDLVELEKEDTLKFIE